MSFMEPWTQPECGDLVHSMTSLPSISSSYVNPQLLAECSSGRTAKNAKRPAEGKASQELYFFDRSKLSSRSEGCLLQSTTLFESSSDSIVEYDDGSLEDGVDDSSFRKSLSYGTLAGVNLVLEGALPSFREDLAHTADPLVSIHNWIVTDPMPTVSENASDADQAVVHQTMRSLLSWKKRKLSFRSPRARGEPLLNKSYGDEGGDDIDHDRRQSCASPSEQALNMVRPLSSHSPLCPFAEDAMLFLHCVFTTLIEQILVFSWWLHSFARMKDPLHHHQIFQDA